MYDLYFIYINQTEMYCNENGPCLAKGGCSHNYCVHGLFPGSAIPSLSG